MASGNSAWFVCNGTVWNISVDNTAAAVDHIIVVFTIQNVLGFPKYFIDGVQQQNITLLPGYKYKLDMSHTSNSVAELAISSAQDGTWGGGGIYSSGVVKIGTDGNAGGYLEFTVPFNVPSKLYYFNKNSSNSGAELNVSGTSVPSDLILSSLNVYPGTMSGPIIKTDTITTLTVLYQNTNKNNYIALKSKNDITENVIFTLPSQDGGFGQVLQTDGYGNLSFGDSDDRLNYKAPDVIVSSTTQNASGFYINITLPNQLVIGYGGFELPFLSKMNILVEPQAQGSATLVNWNEAQSAGNITITNSDPFTRTITQLQLHHNTGTNTVTGTTHKYFGLKDLVNYKVTLTYQNDCGVSKIPTIITSSNIAGGKPTKPLNLSSSIVGVDLQITFTKPLITDDVNNNSIPSITNYYIYYKAVATIRNGALAHMSSHSSSFLKYDNSTNTTVNLPIYGTIINNRLYPGTIYQIYITAKNNYSSLESPTSDFLYAYTDIDKTQFTKGTITYQLSPSSNSHSIFSKIYSIKNPSIPINLNTDLKLFKGSLLSGSGLLLNTITGLRTHFDPNPLSQTNIGTFSATITGTINDNLTMNIPNFDGSISSVSSGNLEISNSKIIEANTLTNTFTSGFFQKQNINIKIKNINGSFNTNKITTHNLLKDYTGYTASTSSLSFSPTIISSPCLGKDTLTFYVDSINANPTITMVTNTITSTSITTYISGIPSIKKYNLQYNFDFNNLGTFFVPLNHCIVSYSNSTISSNTFTNNINYYSITNRNNLVNKTLLDGTILNFHLKSPTVNITINEIIFDNCTLTFNANNIFNTITDFTNSIGPIHYDKTTLEHVHILNNSITHTNGKRVFFNSNVNFSVTYPVISDIVTYSHTQNHTTGNYVKESILYNNAYFGSNNDIGPKKNFTTLSNTAFTGNKYDYSSISGDKFVAFQFSKSLVSNQLTINFTNNSHNDKTIYVKFINSAGTETYWFNADKGFNGKSIFLSSRNNNDGIRNIAKTISTQKITCPTGCDMIIHIVVKIPTTNNNSKFKCISIDNI